MEAGTSHHIHDVGPGFIEGMMPIANVPPGFEAVAAWRRAEESAKNGNPKKAKFLEKRKTYEYHEYPQNVPSDELDEDVPVVRNTCTNEIDCDSDDDN